MMRQRAKTPPKRADALKELAVAVDRLPERLGEAAEGSAPEAWSALVHGRARIVRRFERGGRKYLLLRINLVASRARRLSEREAVVLSRRVQGASLKAIGTELGIAVSTVAYAVRRATAKVGVHTSLELV